MEDYGRQRPPYGDRGMQIQPYHGNTTGDFRSYSASYGQTENNIYDLNKGKSIARSKSHPPIRTMVSQLVKHERIETTVAKAKEVRRFADNMIQLGKDGSLSAARQAAGFVRGYDVLHKIFTELAYRYKSIARDSSGDPVLQQRLIQEDNVSKTMNPIELIQSRPRAFILLLGLTHGLIRRPRVCILGGEFGGLYRALRLESLVWPDDKKPQVVLVDQSNQSERFVFKPMMYELLSGEVDAWEIAPRFSAYKHRDPISPR